MNVILHTNMLTTINIHWLQKGIVIAIRLKKYVSHPKAIPHTQILSCFHRNPHTETFLRFPKVISSHGYSNIFLQFSPYRNHLICKINSTPYSFLYQFIYYSLLYEIVYKIPE